MPPKAVSPAQQQQQQHQSSIPQTYRILFTVIDPLFCLLGVITHLFTPHTTLQGYSPSPLPSALPLPGSPPTPLSTSTTQILDNLAAFFLALGVLEATLLRVRADDVPVWRTAQASLMLLDVVMVGAAVRALLAEGKLGDVGAWRGDDWRLVVGNAAMGVARGACALGWGMGTEGEKGGKGGGKGKRA